MSTLLLNGHRCSIHTKRGSKGIRCRFFHSSMCQLICSINTISGLFDPSLSLVGRNGSHGRGRSDG